MVTTSQIDPTMPDDSTRNFDVGAAPSATPPIPAASPMPAANSTPAASPPKPAAVSTVPAPAPRPKRGGIAGVFDSIADDLAGTQGRPQVHETADGGLLIEHPTLSRKGQWLKIASEAIHGAAAGAGVAPGPGQKGRAFAAGVSEGDKMEQERKQEDQQQIQESRQELQDKFNGVMRKHELAVKEFELQRMQVNAGHDDATFAQQQQDRETKLGSADLGIVKDEGDLADKMSKHEGFWKNVHQNDIVAIPEIGEGGKRLGLHIFQRTPGLGNQQVDPGTPIRIWDAGKHVMTTQVPTVPMTHNELDAYNNTANNQQRQWQIDQNEAEYKKSEVHKNDAEARKADAEAKAAAAAAEPDPALVQSIQNGQIVPERIGYLLGKKEGQKLLAAVAADGKTDTSKLAQYPHLYQDFTSGKTAQQRQNLDNAFKAVDDLTKLNTYSSRLPMGNDRNAWDNRLNAAGQEIANGLAKPGTSATEVAIRDTKKALSQVTFRQSAIDKQVDSLMDAYGSMRTRWTEGAPSAVYEARMPDVGEQTKAIIYKHDPNKGEQWFGKPTFVAAPGKPRLMSFDGKTWSPAP